MLEATLLSRLGEDICLKFQPTNHKYVYLCDCGAASDLTIKDCHDLGALFMSHTHIDHIVGFPFFSPLYVEGNEVTVWSGHLSEVGGVETVGSGVGCA